LVGQYKGILPDTFQEDADVIVEGRLTDKEFFKAITVQAKCPSKYKALRKQREKKVTPLAQPTWPILIKGHINTVLLPM
jgi:cytochrome c-type biogenesis protein CcmE